MRRAPPMSQHGFRDKARSPSVALPGPRLAHQVGARNQGESLVPTITRPDERHRRATSPRTVALGSPRERGRGMAAPHCEPPTAGATPPLSPSRSTRASFWTNRTGIRYANARAPSARQAIRELELRRVGERPSPPDEDGVSDDAVTPASSAGVQMYESGLSGSRWTSQRRPA